MAILLPQLDERQRRLLLGAEARSWAGAGSPGAAAAAGGVRRVHAGEPGYPRGGVDWRGRCCARWAGPLAWRAWGSFRQSDRPGAGGRAGCSIEPDNWWGSDVVAVVDEVDQEPGRRAGDCRRSSGSAMCGSGSCCARFGLKRLQATSRLWRHAAPGPRRPVPHTSTSVQAVSEGRGSGHLCRPTAKEGTRRGNPGYKNNGRRWSSAASWSRSGPQRLPRPGHAQGCPHGIYDLSANTGWVTVARRRHRRFRRRHPAAVVDPAAQVVTRTQAPRSTPTPAVHRLPGPAR